MKELLAVEVADDGVYHLGKVQDVASSTRRQAGKITLGRELLLLMVELKKLKIEVGLNVEADAHEAKGDSMDGRILRWLIFCDGEIARKAWTRYKL